MVKKVDIYMMVHFVHQKAKTNSAHIFMIILEKTEFSDAYKNVCMVCVNIKN